MKTRLLFPSIALSLLLAACVAPLPAPPPRVQLPGSEKPQLPLEQKPEANKTQIELPVVPAPQADEITIQTPALPADDLRDFGQIRAAEEQKYSQLTPALPADDLRDFGQIRAAEEQKTYPAVVVTPQASAQDRYIAMKQLYEAGYQPPNALLNAQAYRYAAVKQLYDAGYRPPNALLDNTR